jgi:hypothetical protein
LRPLFYAVALQSQVNAYVFKVTKHEQTLVDQLVERVTNMLSDQNTLLVESELTDLLVVINMYQPYSLPRRQDLSKLPYSLVKLFQSQPQPIKPTQEQNINVDVSSQVVQFYQDQYVQAGSLLQTDQSLPIPYHTELEWTYPQQFWPKGFEDVDQGKRKENVLLLMIGGNRDNSLVTKHGDTIHIDQVCTCLYFMITLYQVELISNKHYSLTCKYYEHADQVQTYMQYLPPLQQQYDMLQVMSHVTCIPNIVPTIGTIIKERVRQGGVVKISFIGYHLGMMIKDTREYLYHVSIIIDVC